jgi:hypothetical protein
LDNFIRKGKVSFGIVLAIVFHYLYKNRKSLLNMVFT